MTQRRTIDICPMAAHTRQMPVLPSICLGAARLAVVVLLLVCAVAPAADAADAPEKAAQAVSRLTYGPAPGDIGRVAEMGVSEFIRQQLSPETLEEDPELARALGGLPTESMDTIRLFREFGPSTPSPGTPPGAEAMRRTFDRADVVVLEATKARLLRAILSKRQLYELMVAFWCDHFSLGGKKGLAYLWSGSFEREAIRPNAMGKFIDLLAATAMHPAMLIARDNWKNVVHRENGAPVKEELNPAYAATLLANHTLGQGGPQKPADVTALARILTGWRVGASRADSDTGGFYFDVERHDPSDKLLLGRPIKGTGLAEGVQALRILAEHPATARNICRKLAVYFLTDDPPAALVSRLAEAFSKNGGDIRETLLALFGSPEFFDPKYAGGRLKSPLRQVVSAVRALGGVPTDTAALAGELVALGQPLYAAEGPEGYGLASSVWLKPELLPRRVTFAGDLAGGRLPGLGLKKQRPSEASLVETLGPTLSQETRQAAQRTSGDIGAAVILGSPDFMRY